MDTSGSSPKKHLGPVNSIKYVLWRYAITPIFPHFRDLLLRLHIIEHSGRQAWLLGWIAPGKTLDEFLAHLETIGFHNHFVAWVDDGQVVSFRKHDGFTHQYHLRIFEDGEVRGHYEKTPESHPIDHFVGECFEPRREEFERWLDGWLTGVPLRHAEVLAPRAFAESVSE